MKKAGFLLLVAILCVALTGCNKTAKVKLDPKNPVTVTLWHYYNGAQKSAFDDLVGEFNRTVGAEQGIIIEASNQGNVNQLIENVLASADNKVGTLPIPNLFTGYADTVYQIDRKGLVASLNPYFTEKELAAYIPAYIQEGYLGQGDQLKILPTAKSTELFILNKTDWEPFAADTGADTDALATYEGIARTAKAYYEWTDAKTPDVANDGKAFFGRDAMANYLIIGNRQLGCEIFSLKDGQVVFQVEEAAMQRIWDNYYVPFISGYYAANGKFRSDDAKVGDLISLVGSSSSASYFPTQVVHDDDPPYPVEALVLQPPVFEGADKVAVQQGAGMAMTQSTPERMYAASVFMKWFTEPDRNTQFSISTGYMPVRTEASDMVKLDAAMEKLEPNETSDLTRQALAVAIQTTGGYEMYTNHAFENGTAARNVLEKAFADLVKEDRAQVVALLEQGMALEDAVAQVNTPERFQRWMAQIERDLNETQKGK